MTDFTIQILDDYIVPEGQMTKEQYVNFVMNRAAERYHNQYGTSDKVSGIQAACDAYNATVVVPTPEPTPE